jgi:hypothetical protein
MLEDTCEPSELNKLSRRYELDISTRMDRTKLIREGMNNSSAIARLTMSTISFRDMSDPQTGGVITAQAYSTT